MTIKIPEYKGSVKEFCAAIKAQRGWDTDMEGYGFGVSAERWRRYDFHGQMTEIFSKEEQKQLNNIKAQLSIQEISLINLYLYRS